MVKRNVPRETMDRKNQSILFHVKQYIIVIAIIILGFSAGWYFPSKIDGYTTFVKSLEERSLYQEMAVGLIQERPLSGWGMGSFVPSIPQVFHVELEPWQYQPVHNIFFLVWSELGIVGLFLILVFLWKSISHVFVPRGTNIHGTDYCFTLLLIGWITIMSFDHYFWDLQQGQILLWTVLALATVERLSVEQSKGKPATTG